MRELVSNGCDAVTKLKKLVGIGEAKIEDDPHYKVTVSIYKKAKKLVISDNGIGIEENELKNVFEGFYRVDSSRSIKGSGLGLGIAKQIVEKHGGKIWLKSDGLGKGTTAVVFLPKI